MYLIKLFKTYTKINKPKNEESKDITEIQKICKELDINEEMSRIMLYDEE